MGLACIPSPRARSTFFQRPVSTTELDSLCYSRSKVPPQSTTSSSPSSQPSRKLICDLSASSIEDDNMEASSTTAGQDAFKAGDRVIFDLVTPSGAKHQVWGEIVSKKHGLFDGKDYRVRVLKVNIYKTVYDVNVHNGSYVEEDAWVGPSGDEFETAKVADMKLCSDDPSDV